MKCRRKILVENAILNHSNPKNSPQTSANANNNIPEPEDQNNNPIKAIQPL